MSWIDCWRRSWETGGDGSQGALSLYGRMLGREIDAEEVKKSIALVTRFPEYQFRTTVRPVARKEGTRDRLSHAG